MRPECAWISREFEQKAQSHAVAHVVPEHLTEVRSRKLDLIAKTEIAVKNRSQRDHLLGSWGAGTQIPGTAGRPNAKLNSDEARKRADGLQARLENAWRN